MKAPPLLPEETLHRVLRVARFDGLSVAFVAGLFALISALAGDAIGATIGLLVAGAGAIELHGASLLVHGEDRGMKWLVSSQLYLMLVIIAYCVLQLARAKFPTVPPELESLIQQDADQLGLSVTQLLHLFNRLLYCGVALATVIYQGGMTIFYVRRQRPVIRALDAEL